MSTAAAPEGVLHRRIEFHLARRPHAAVTAGGGGFRMETLNPQAAGKVGAPAAAGSGEGGTRRSEKGNAGVIDPELSVARIYLGRIVSPQSCSLFEDLSYKSFVLIGVLGGKVAMSSVFASVAVNLGNWSKISCDFGYLVRKLLVLVPPSPSREVLVWWTMDQCFVELQFVDVLQGAGLQNLGNTCYLNSVLQCLTYTEPFAAYLQSGKHKSSCKCCCYCQPVSSS